MKHPRINGPFSHDLMTTVLCEQFPQLEPGRDYMIGHPVSETTGEQSGEPFVMYWRSADVPEPVPENVRAEFEGNEAHYRALFARRYRNACLDACDGKARIDDAPASMAATMAAWAAYRQGLRDVPQQSGFPFSIDWPEWPGDAS
jgi:hypothetical protein